MMPLVWVAEIVEYQIFFFLIIHSMTALMVDSVLL